RDALRAALVDGGRLLDVEQAPSDAWFALAKRLQRECWRLGSATHCMREWAEPDDAKPDVDDRSAPGDENLDPEERGSVRYLRSGRRNVWRWDET
ncbi:MAG: hypothetical protein WBQ21_00785, partial [Solirubrobacteraceae bacterium]